MKPSTIFIFERTATLCASLRESLSACEHETRFATDKSGFLHLLEVRQPDLVILGPSVVGPGNGLELAEHLHRIHSKVPLLLVVTNSSEELAIAALQAGISEYLKYPFAPHALTHAVRRCLETRTVLPFKATRDPVEILPGGALALDGIIGESCAMQEIRRRISRVASSDSNVLITGETGTGKELLAEAVHNKKCQAQPSAGRDQLRGDSRRSPGE